MSENLKERFRQISLAYHQRGLEVTWVEIRKMVSDKRYLGGLSLREALEEVETDAQGRYVDEE